ncbi:hypothetical protein F4808DRAFT_362548 [Astrocystis sublimbata]|nr:hypothetical protein F4808DRAFT_362548 [Astrocystis sublimbata]
MDPSASSLNQSMSARGARETAPPGAFATAIDEFLSELKEKHKEDSKNPFLQALASPIGTPGADGGPQQIEVSALELQRSVLELDAKKRAGKGYQLLHRLSPFLEVFKSVLKRCEQLAQLAPSGVAIAFSGARIVLELAQAVDEYLEIIVVAMQRVAGILEIYQRLSPSPDLGPRLVHSYKEIITFWYKLSKVLSSSKPRGILPRALVTPLKKETEEALKGLQEDMHINLGISQAIEFQMTDADRQARADAEQKSLKNNIRQWIMGRDGVDFKGDCEIRLDLRHENTCSWIFEDTRFQEWCGSRENALLWYNAQPGSGKSVLASAVIDYLTRADKKVAYFFYSFSKHSNRYVADGLRTLALQLLGFTKTPSDKLVDLYEKEIQFSPYLSNLRVIASVVHELITRNDDLYIVIDGIDECEDEKDMMSHMEWLIGRPTLGTTRWLFTNRVSEVEKTLRKMKAVEIRPSPDAIREDIRSYLSTKISCQSRLRAWAAECDNNFLIARFVSEVLGKLTSEADIRAELATFPKKLNGFYARTLAKIDALGPMEQSVARRIFLTLSAAQQTMSVDELLDALAIKRGSKDYSASRLPKEELIHELCGSLVIVEERITGSTRTQLVRFCHKSVRDFFRQDPKTSDLDVDESLHKYFVTPSAAHEEIGLNCLTYLMYGRYSKHMDFGFLDKNIPKEHAFLRYAATFWFQHLSDAFVQQPSPVSCKTVQEFIGSKNFWNCLCVQSHVVPYIFGRYISNKRGYNMAIKGREWKGDDSFAVPLPTWLSDCSPDGSLKDQSLCNFVDEWREVMITHSQVLDQCVPMKPFISSCWLRPLSKTAVVKCVNLENAFNSHDLTASQIIGLGFSGRKLVVEVAYRTKDDPPDVMRHLKQPLFKTQSQPKQSHQKLPVESNMSEWVIRQSLEDGIENELIAWSVDTCSMDLRKVSREHSERFKPPTRLGELLSASKLPWDMLGCRDVNGTDSKSSASVIHMAQRSAQTWSSGHNDCSNEDSDDDSESSDTASEESLSDDEDEFSDDESLSETASDEHGISELDTDESDVESSAGNQKNTSYLIIISNGRAPFWTQPWTHQPLMYSKIICAAHPTKPVVAFMYKSSQLEVINLDEGTHTSIEVSGISDGLGGFILASTRELYFSPCGNVLHCVFITFARQKLYTECSVTKASLNFPSDNKGITATHLVHVKYTLADPLIAIEPPSVLTYWYTSHVIVALPPLTCSPKILKLVLDGDSVSTLRNPIYFPASTPRRDPRLVYRPSSQDAEGYVFLVLNAVPPVGDATSKLDPGSPVVALRWCVHDDEGWRPWDKDEDDTSLDMANDSTVWNLMRGTFVESGKPFSVPVRCGLNWTRKSYLSCG